MISQPVFLLACFAQSFLAVNVPFYALSRIECTARVRFSAICRRQCEWFLRVNMHFAYAACKVGLLSLLNEFVPISLLLLFFFLLLSSFLLSAQFLESFLLLFFLQFGLYAHFFESFFFLLSSFLFSAQFLKSFLLFLLLAFLLLLSQFFLFLHFFVFLCSSRSDSCFLYSAKAFTRAPTIRSFLFLSSRRLRSASCFMSSTC